MNNELPFVSVVVPVLNGERTVRGCLTSLLYMDYPEGRREILVVDNGSTDGTVEIIKSFSVRYLQEKCRGISYARNRGIEASRGEIIAFTDSDCVVSRGWLRELVQGFKRKEVGGMEGETVDYPPTTPAEQYMARRRSYSRNVRLASPLSPYAVTANAAFRRDVFDKIGVFDSRLPSGEDVDFSWRFFQGINLELGYNPRAVVFHRHRNTVCGFFYQHIRVGRGIAVLRTKYPNRLPWSLCKELQAWAVLAGLACIVCKTAIQYWLRDGKKTDYYDCYFTFLRKLGVRIGFVYEASTGKQQW